MAATPGSALLMIVLWQRRRFVQKRKRKREESEQEVDVFKRGQSRLIYGNAIDLGPCCGYDERGALHRKISRVYAREATSGAGPPLCCE
jgi:hypothetical protein